MYEKISFPRNGHRPGSASRMGGSADVRRVRDGIDIAAEKEKREDKKAGKKRERRKQDGKEKK